MFTYSQDKIGFSYFYCKRKVLRNEVTTEPLELILNPWPNKIVLIEKTQDNVSNLYHVKSNWEM